MKKICVILLAFALLCSPFSVYRAGAAAPNRLKSQTAVLMDSDTGQVLYDKWMSRRVYPASTTKILTALLVVENARPYEIMTVSDTALEDITWDSSHIALTEGEELTVEDGLYALMLPSANDAANVLAEHVAGSREAFAVMMNQKAREIGALDSHFANAHGLHDDNHYTTAYDMALITQHAMGNEQFRKYFGTDRYTMPATNKNDERPFTNYQYMLVKDTGYYDPDVIGGKVGFTSQAQNTMSTVATQGGRTLVCVVMHSASKGDKFNDTSELLSFGFREFVPFTISADSFSGFEVPALEDSQEVGKAVFSLNSDFTALLHDSADPSGVRVTCDKPQFYDADNPAACEVSFEFPDSPPYIPSLLGSLPLDVEVDIPVLSALAPVEEESPEPFLIKALKTCGIVLCCFMALFLLLDLYRWRRNKKRRRKRRERLEHRRRESAVSAVSEASSRRPPPAARTAQSATYSRNAGVGGNTENRRRAR